MKIALFGGTFDPVHKGHVNAAKEVVRQGLVEEVWFIPVKWHAFKENLEITDLVHRKKMIELAIEGIPGLKLVDLDENPTYTIDTLLEIKKRFPENSYFWLMGTNLVREFSSWKQPERILQEAKLILFPVSGLENEESELIEQSNPVRVSASPIELSSSKVRERLRDGENVSGLVSDNVLAYIEENGLYKDKK